MGTRSIAVMALAILLETIKEDGSIYRASWRE